jgi:hypothetical protein
VGLDGIGWFFFFFFWLVGWSPNDHDFFHFGLTSFAVH